MIELEVTLVRSSSEVDKKFFEVWSNTGVPESDATFPQFVTIPSQNWSVGQTISFFLSDSLLFLPPGSILSYALSDLSQALPLDVELNTITGEVAGVVAELQGGTYNLVFLATGSFGTIQSSLAVTLVALPLVAPTLTNPSDIGTGNLEEGSSGTIQLVSTNPESNVLQFEIVSGDFDTMSIDAASGLVSYTVAAGQDTGSPYTVTYKVTDTTTLLSDTASHSVTIDAVTGASETPILTGWFSGALECAVAVVPTWSAGGDTFYVAISDLTEKSIDMLGLYLASDGGADVTGVVATGALAPLLELQETVGGAGIGFITGVNDGVATGEYPFTLVATNSVGPSLSSPTFTFSVYDDAVVTPTITAIYALEGTNDIVVTFSEPVYTTAGTLASYILDWLFEVNPVTPAVYRSVTAVSGGGTNQITYTVDGLVFSPANTIRVAFTRVTSDLKSLSADQSVADNSIDFVIQQPGVFDLHETYALQTVGSKPDGWGSTLSVITDEQFRSAGRAIKHQTLECPFQCFGTWGGITPSFGKNLVHGDEIWIQISTYYPSSFDFGTNNSPKFIRLRQRDALGEGKGYDDFYMGDNEGFCRNENAEPDPVFDPRFPYNSEQIPSNFNITYDTWETWEFYMKFDSQSLASGNGTGRMRLWKNHQHIHDMPNMIPMFSTTWYMEDRLYIFTQLPDPVWGQFMYTDELIVTTRPPANRDSEGFPYIGDVL